MSDLIQFEKWICNLELGLYHNGRLALSLVSAVSNDAEGLFVGEPIATASVNLDDIELKDDEILIKDYSENEGMFLALQKAGYIGEAVSIVTTEWVKTPLVKKTEKLLSLEKEFRANLPQLKKKYK